MEIEELTTTIIINKISELVAKGYSQEQSEAAVKKARRWAETISKGIRANHRDDAFLDLFISQLDKSEDWLNSVKDSKSNWKDGLEAAGVAVGPQTEKAFSEWAK